MATTLEHAGETIDDPSDADIARILAEPRDADWFLALNRGDDSMEVMLDAGDLWVEVMEGERFVQARSRLDETVVKSMLASFRDGTDAWRDMALWKEPPPRKKDTLKGPAGLILGMVVAIVAVAIAGPVVTGNGGWIVVAFALALPATIAAAMGIKLAQVKRAQAWTKAPGRITRSELATETRHGKEVQVPRIEYEFKVGFHKLTGRRVSFAEVIAGPQAREALARYLAGTSVQVYYDPANPSDCVVEREMPSFVHAAWGVVAVLTAAILFGAWWYLVR
jgi:hypothetical protein